ncbi:MAG: hypothetical protein KAT68_07840 [Bacteroidales bacterium]|nr:hypothetical protein [Bacteroidales bacterium]
MLIKNFYKIVNIKHSNNSIIGKIILNEKHNVYKGHFPAQPVVPGVIQIQIVKEILSETINKNLLLKNAGNIKYLALLTPSENRELNVIIEYKQEDNNDYNVKASINSSNTTFMKLKGVYSLA